jgi:hypothetical protein
MLVLLNRQSTKRDSLYVSAIPAGETNVANQGRAVGLYRGREHGHREPRVQHRRRRDCIWGFLVAGWQRERGNLIVE